MDQQDGCVIRNARVYRAQSRSFERGDVWVREGRIEAVAPSGAAVPDGRPSHDAEGRMLLPGLVDVHTHGRAGGDFLSADDALLVRMCDSYLEGGVTTVLPTLASAPLDDLYAAIDRLNRLNRLGAPNGARLAGVHLEGRYLNPARRGAHAAELLFPLDPDELGPLLRRIRGARHVTAALELDADGSFLRRALAEGATIALGHTDADFQTAEAVLRNGATALTHLFNAMSPLHHRDGGAVLAGFLSDSAFCELICDGFHIAPPVVRLAYRVLGERLVLITDSMEATGCPDGEYRIAGSPVTVRDGRARTHDGAIAGSTLSLWQAVRNLQTFAGASLGDAVYAATLAPALEAGLSDDLGSIDAGKRADLVLLDADGASIERVMRDGRWRRP